MVGPDVLSLPVVNRVDIVKTLFDKRCTLLAAVHLFGFAGDSAETVQAFISADANKCGGVFAVSVPDAEQYHELLKLHLRGEEREIVIA